MCEEQPLPYAVYGREILDGKRSWEELVDYLSAHLESTDKDYAKFVKRIESMPIRFAYDEVARLVAEAPDTVTDDARWEYGSTQRSQTKTKK